MGIIIQQTQLNGIERRMQNIHNSILAKWNIKARANSDKKIAQNMQKVLIKLKYFSNPQIKRTKETEGFIANIIEENEEKLYEEIIKNLPPQFQQLFTTRHKAGKSIQTQYGADDIVEAEFSAFLSALQKIGTNNQSVVAAGTFLSGRKNVNIKEQISNNLNNALKELQKKLSSQGLKYSSKAENSLFDTNVKPASGKTDVSMIQFNITTTLNEEMKNIITLFNKNYNFTIKNYSAYYNGDILRDRQIHLGESSFIKTIVATLSIANKNSTSFLWALTKAELTDPIKIHINHLRFLYELTGGIQILHGTQTMAKIPDFLILNIPNNSYRIYVRSVYELIANEFESKSNIFNQYQISLSMKSFFDS